MLNGNTTHAIRLGLGKYPWMQGRLVTIHHHRFTHFRRRRMQFIRSLRYTMITHQVLPGHRGRLCKKDYIMVRFPFFLLHLF
jgi:hypothetical protein